MHPLEPFILGASLMGGLIVGFGPQNLFLLRIGIAGRDRWVAPTVSTACDAALVATGVFSAGRAAELLGSDPAALAKGGAILLAIYGVRALVRPSPPLTIHHDAALTGSSGWPVAGWALAFALLNPYVWLDSLLIIGMGAMSIERGMRFFFALGAVVISAFWFFGLTLGARALRPLLSRPGAERGLDLSVAFICFVAAWNIYF